MLLHSCYVSPPFRRSCFSTHPSRSRTPFHSASSTRRRSLLSALIFPAAATVTTDVWLHSSSISSFVGYDLVLALINVTGAFCDGFFSAWETGAAMPSGAKTEALHLIADDMRTYYLSTYTSWAGMVGVAASMAHLRSSALMGLVYILMCIFCSFVAHGERSGFVECMF